MKIYAIASGLMLLAGLLAASADDHTVTWEGGSATLEGVCSVDPELSCWGPDGKPRKDLAQEMLGRGGFGVSVYKKRGFKHRLVVIRVEGQISGSIGGGNMVSSSGSSPGGKNLMNIVATIYFRGESTHGVWEGSRSIWKSVEVPFKPGSVLRSPGHDYTILDTREGQTTGYSVPIKTTAGKTWTIRCDAKAFNAKLVPPQVTAYDADGLTIRAVDPDGEPVLINPALIQNVSFAGYGSQQKLPDGVSLSRFLPAIPVDYQNPKTVEFTTNIDPSKIKFLRYFETETIPIKFSGIPLEPRN